MLNVKLGGKRREGNVILTHSSFRRGREGKKEERREGEKKERERGKKERKRVECFNMLVVRKRRERKPINVELRNVLVDL